MKYKNEEQIIKIHEYQGNEGKLPLLEYELLNLIPNIKHCFTTRAGGVSEGIYSSLNLSFTRGDNPENVKKNYEIVANAFDTTIDAIVTSDQTHTTNVRVVTKEDAGCGVTRERNYTDIDGMITNEKGLLLATFYADCVPLYFVDPVHQAIGLSHSGWKGTVHRMGEATICKMTETFDTNPKDLICAIGPSICQDCYEVSTDVAEQFIAEFSGHQNEILIDKENGKYQLDLWKANEIVLLAAGVRKEHLAITNLCTCCNYEELFSHRASRGKRGNLGAFLMLT